MRVEEGPILGSASRGTALGVGERLGRGWREAEPPQNRQAPGAEGCAGLPQGLEGLVLLLERLDFSLKLPLPPRELEDGAVVVGRLVGEFAVVAEEGGGFLLGPLVGGGVSAVLAMVAAPETISGTPTGVAISRMPATICSAPST